MLSYRLAHLIDHSGHKKRDASRHSRLSRGCKSDVHTTWLTVGARGGSCRLPGLTGGERVQLCAAALVACGLSGCLLLGHRLRAHRSL
jgi:hypothetical protein